MFLFIFIILLTVGANAEESIKISKNSEAKEKSSNKSEIRVFQNLFNNNLFNPGSVSSMAIMGLAGVFALTQVIPLLMAVFGLALRPDILNLRRSLEDFPWASDWIKRYGVTGSDITQPEKLVTRLFDRLGVTDLECRKLIICEVQRHPVTKFGEIGKAMTRLYGHLSISDVDPFSYKQFHEAWKHGNNQENCLQIYNRCKIPSTISKNNE